MTVKAYCDIFRNELREFYSEAESTAIAALVLRDVLNMSRVDLALRGDHEMETHTLNKLKGILLRLKNEEPIQYILGKTEFYGLEFLVKPTVLIPRPETEELVRWILDSNAIPAPKILDLGTGSGCIPLALKKNLPNSIVSALDKSTHALELARYNAKRLNLKVEFYEFDMLVGNFNTFHSVDILVSNPPYVRVSEKEQMKPNVLQYEPEMALFVQDQDPFVFYHRIGDAGRDIIKDGGLLFLEINEKFGFEITELLEDKGYSEIELKKDLNGRDRMIKARKN